MDQSDENNSSNKTVFLKDYKESDYLISETCLEVELDDEVTVVKSKLMVTPNYDTKDLTGPPPLKLDGEELDFKGVKINGVVPSSDEYQVNQDGMIIKSPPEGDFFTLEIENRINPKANKKLEGLYKSGNVFCTQNEAEGFRRITYFIDRPDIMSKYTTRIIADKKDCPVLLSNGSMTGSGELPAGKHWVEWKDPFAKPCYLFALVAGDLGHISDCFTTRNGKKIDLKIYCDKGNEDRCHFAMQSVKKAMAWDEQKYGLEYDLDIFMIVAVDAFNAGAMENKGLNIFNSKYILADPRTATDDNFSKIEAIIGHEYFHNYTGNRITCRDWFQLTLKEGLTVFRDKHFSADMNSSVVERIKSVETLRRIQFAEDKGPMAHPIRPESYMKIDNFYTPTVYMKGAEVIGMVSIFLGEEGFRRGIDKYFELYDGQAVTTEDFLHAMSVANNNFDFSQFKNWYSIAGTPEVRATYDYNDQESKFILNIEQSCPPTPGRKIKPPFHFPLKMGLIDRAGNDIKLELLNPDGQEHLEQGVLHIRHERESFTFINVNERPIPSLNRGFSAPINMEVPYSFDEKIFLLKHDRDGFNRFEVGRELGIFIISKLISDYHDGKELKVDQGLIDAFGIILENKELDNSFKALCLELPPSSVFFQIQNPIDHGATNFVRDFVKMTLATVYKDKLFQIYHQLDKEKEYKLDSVSIGSRALKNTILGYLMELEGDSDYRTARSLARKQFDRALNMTDELAAFMVLAHKEGDDRQEVIGNFHKKWKGEQLVIQNWFLTQALSPLPGTLDRVTGLLEHPLYDKTIPNLVNSLIGAFAANSYHFHSPDGKGYKFIADQVLELDKINPHVSSGIVGHAFNSFGRLSPDSKELARNELKRISETSGISGNMYEIVFKILMA